MATCYILKKGIIGNALYSIERNERPTVVAFKKAEHARTMKRLINEMNNVNNVFSAKRIETEQVCLEYMIRACKTSQLNLILYESVDTYTVYEAPRDADDEVIFDLEMRIRYG